MRTSASYTSLYVRFALSKILRIYFALMQSNSANPKSLATYVRSKGLTEQALAEIGYSDTIIYRPGFLKGAERPDFRFLESVFSSVLLLDSFPCDILGLRLISGSPFFYRIKACLITIIICFGQYRDRRASSAVLPLIYVCSLVGRDQVSVLAKSIRISGQLGSANLPAAAAATQQSWGGKPFTTIGNKGSLYLAKENV